MKLKEQPVYAGSRIGIYFRQANNYQYQLSDHLGNVRAVIKGTKLGNGNADVVFYADYYPFGTVLRSGGTGWRYGYQGEYAEKDNETGWNSFELRNYDAEIGRWLSVDPYGQYASPYVGMGNSPVMLVDANGGWADGDGPGFLGRVWDGIKSTLGFGEDIAAHIQLDEVTVTAKFSDIGNKGDVFANWGYNFSIAVKMTKDWAFGTGSEFKVFKNDAVSNSFRNARVIGQARDYWYKEVNYGKKTIYDGLENFVGERAWTGGNFGATGLVFAGLDPIEQFVGSFTPEITSDGINLTYIIRNTTSFKSLTYGIGPAWNRSKLSFGGNMRQIYIFTEAIDFNKINRFLQFK